MTRGYSISTKPLWFSGGRLYRLSYLLSSLWHIRSLQTFDFEPQRVLVFLISRDLYSCLDSIIEKCTLAGILPKNIFILDQGSVSEKCKEAYSAYQSQGVNVLSVFKNSEALGPYVVWLDDSIVRIHREYNYPYIVTDTDLRFPESYPEDWLERMFYFLNKHKIMSKIALPIKVSDIDVDNSDKIVSHEGNLGSSFIYRLLGFFSRESSPSRVCQTDTTFSLYRPGAAFSTISLRLETDYEIFHMPWYRSFVTTPEYEFYRNKKRAEFGMWS